MFWFGSDWAFWQAGLMWVGMIAFWALLIWGVYVLISSATRKSGRVEHDEARRILDRRLARGEIDAEELGRLRDLISAKDADDRAGSASAS
jgi:uncharacterized membrane protein